MVTINKNQAYKEKKSDVQKGPQEIQITKISETEFQMIMDNKFKEIRD